MMSPTISTTCPYIGLTFGIMNIIFMQNVNAGAPIRNVDKYSDAASGPKINLPPHRNF